MANHTTGSQRHNARMARIFDGAAIVNAARDNPTPDTLAAAELWRNAEAARRERNRKQRELRRHRG